MDSYSFHFSTYVELREHFKKCHFLCEEGDCKDEQFTSAFRSDIDLKGHKVFLLLSLPIALSFSILCSVCYCVSFS